MKKLSIVFTVMFFIGIMASPVLAQTTCGSDAECDDGLYCNGDETCNETTEECDPGTPIDCDDGLYCNGDETCNETTGECDPGTPIDCKTVSVDIKPGSCPNPFNLRSRGVLPVAVLGTEEFDLSEIDLSTIQLAGVSPIRSGLEDVSTPAVIEDECACTTEGGDGIDDLTLKFYRQEIVEVLGEVSDGDVMVLTLTGELLDGTLIEGEDCIRIIKKLKWWQNKLKKPKKPKKPKK